MGISTIWNRLKRNRREAPREGSPDPENCLSSPSARPLPPTVIDPDLARGLSAIVGFLSSKYNEVRKAVMSIPHSGTAAINLKLNEISDLLSAFTMLFREDYLVKPEILTMKTIRESFQYFIDEKKGDKRISITCETCLPENILTDRYLFFQAARAVLANSVDSIGDEGSIGIRIFRFVKLPGGLARDLGIEGFLKEYNSFCEANRLSFPESVKKNKSIPGPSMKRIEDSMLEFAAFDFIDTGPGVPPSFENRLFRIFFTTRSDTHFGLGLSLARAFLERLGGSIDYIGSGREGTRFRILVPLVRE